MASELRSNTCGGFTPCRLPSPCPRGLLPILQETQCDRCCPSEQEDLWLQAFHRRWLRPLRPLLLRRQHAQRHDHTPLPAHLWEHGRSRSRPLQGWGHPHLLLVPFRAWLFNYWITCTLVCKLTDSSFGVKVRKLSKNVHCNVFKFLIFSYSDRN